MTSTMIYHLTETGAWVRELSGTFSVAGAPRSWHRDVMTAVLWAGDGGAASHRSAAAIWGLDGFPREAIEISTVKPLNSPRSDIKVHRVDGHLPPEIVEVENIPTTSVRRTILDLCAIKHPRAEGALDCALVRRLTTIDQMWMLYDHEWIRGRRGVRILRLLLIERTPGRAPTHSELERIMKRLIKRERFPEPVRQHEVTLSFGPIHIDFAYPDRKLAIETDSYGYHGDLKAFDRDRERDAELQALGWRVLRFTWVQLRWRKRYVAEMIRIHLEMTPSA